MKTSLISRFFVALAALLFAVLGLEFWVAPEQAAHRFGLEPLRAAGVSALRADLGGLFIALAVLCAIAAWTRRRGAILAAMLLLAAIAVGRSIGFISGGFSDRALLELVVEVTAIAALATCLGGSGAANQTGQRGGSLRPATIVTAIVLLAAAGAGAALLTPSVQQSIFDRAAENMSARVNSGPLADDALRVAIAGSSAPLPSASRAKASVAVFAGGKMYIVDAGPESTENLVLWGVPLSSIGGVFLTHFHSDHIGDLGELQLQTWAGGRAEPLAVYGGPGVERVVAGFNEAYRQDQGYRTEHHGEKVMPSASWGMVAHRVDLDGPATPRKDRTRVILDDGALRITAIEVDHAPIEPSYAYRFDYKGRSVVISGDLKYHEPLARAASGADILISEAIAKNMTQSLGGAARTVGRDRTAAIMHDIEDYHISPEEAARLANMARVKLLVYYHLLPAPDGFLPRRLFAQGINEARRGDWTMADDGSLYTLPIGSSEIEIGQINEY